MSAINEAYPEYQSTGRLDELRATEYGYLDEQGHVYLDYTGADLAARAQHRAHEMRLMGTTFGNPHSVSPTSQASNRGVERVREHVLSHLNASPDEYVVVFTANATAAIRLVGESYPFRRGTRLVLTSDNRNSVNGLRVFAKRAHARTLAISAVCAIPSWVGMAQDRGYDVLLDAVAYLPTGTLDLSSIKPEFVVISWYKLFGLPTGVGCLVARRDALARLQRPWFSGGSIQAATVRVPWHAMAGDESAFEDGTLNFLSIPDVHFGLSWLAEIGMDVVATRQRDLDRRGGTVSFNLLDAVGAVVDERLVALEASAVQISIRTGCFCNPGVGEDAFGVDADTLRPLIKARTKSFEEFLQTAKLPTDGAIRVSFGIASNTRDVDFFIAFVRKTYRDRITATDGLPPRDTC